MAKYRFGDICKVLNGRAYKQNELLASGKYPILRVGNFFSSDRWYYSDMELPEDKYCDYEDLLFAWSASFGPKIWDGEKVIYHYHIWKLIPNDDIADKWYLYYWLRHSVNRLTAGTHGSVMAHMTKGDMENQSIELPSLQTQRKISSILRTIDEKIHNNVAINNNLEQQAQALYENIFCIPSDIETKLISLSDLMDYAGGSQPPASEFIFSERDGYIRFVQIRDYDTDSHITYIPDSPKNKLCEEHDIMIARYGASLGRICFGINGAYNVALAKVFPKKSYFREFLRCYLSSRTFYEGINNKGGRSAQAGFNQSDINSFEIDFPVDETIVKNFECTVAPMFEQRLQLKKENQHLASLRDTLLPKLMSGELDVSNVEL